MDLFGCGFGGVCLGRLFQTGAVTQQAAGCFGRLCGLPHRPRIAEEGGHPGRSAVRRSGGRLRRCGGSVGAVGKGLGEIGFFCRSARKNRLCRLPQRESQNHEQGFGPCGVGGGPNGKGADLLRGLPHHDCSAF